MKFVFLTSLLIALVLWAGCGSPDPAADSAAETKSSANRPTADDSTATSDRTPPTVAPTVEAVAETGLSSPEPSPTGESAAEDASPQPTTRAEYEQQFAQAVNQLDWNRALEVVNAALADFPDDVQLHAYHVFATLQVGSQQSATDLASAAQQFIEAGALARSLQQREVEQNPIAKQAIQQGLVSEARGYAYEGKIPETLAALQDAAAAGFLYLRFDQDDFFASLVDNDEFKAGIDKLIEAEAQRAIRDAESFAFDFSLPDLDQNQVNLSDFRGKVVIVDIWGTWCPPCREEIPHFVKLQNAYPDELAIVGINYENSEGEEAIEGIREFAADYGINYPCVIGDDQTREQIPNFEGYPTTLFLDRDGQVRLQLVGLQPYAILEAYVTALIEDDRG